MQLNFKFKNIPNPSKFSLFDVNPNIYSQLITNHEYEVKSNVCEDIFQSFIDN